MHAVGCHYRFSSVAIRSSALIELTGNAAFSTYAHLPIQTGGVMLVKEEESNGSISTSSLCYCARRTFLLRTSGFVDKERSTSDQVFE